MKIGSHELGAVMPQNSAMRAPGPAIKPESLLSGSSRRSGVFGLFERKERWSLTPLGWATFLFGVALLLGLVFVRIHPFLAETDRTASQFLVVEGWVPNYALSESIAEFKTKPYRLIFTVGCDIQNGVNVEPGDNHATYAVRRLAWLGMNPRLVQPVPSPTQYRNRTYASAVAFRQWVEQNQLSVTSFNLVTVGVHARRSRLLFQKAFGSKVRVGVIAVEDREYDPRRWWQYSEGVREVISEGAGYLYARFLFRPETKDE